jgi:hypothetical protein
MRPRIVALALLAIVATGCSGAVNQEYSSAEGKYRARFPGKPRLSEQTVSTPIGPIVLKIASSSDWSRTERFVSYADYPVGLIHPGNKDPMLDGACQGMATEARLVILSKMPITIDGHPGREVSFEAQPGHTSGRLSGRARIYLVGARLYQVFIAGPTGRLTPETIDAFLNSFSLVDPAPQPPTIAPGPPPSAVRPSASPRDANRSPMGFYAIPDPPTEPIVAVTMPPVSVSVVRPVDQGTSPSSHVLPGSARIRGFAWIDQDTKVVGGPGAAGKPEVTNDQHFRLSVEMPQNTIVEGFVLDAGGAHRWVTQPSDRDGPIAIFQDGRPVARTYVAQVGVYAGSQDFDLYINTGVADGTGTSFEVQVVLSIAGDRVTLKAQCRRPAQPAGPLAGAPRSERMPDGSPAPPAPAATSTPPGAPAVSPRPAVSGHESTDVPAILKPSAAGASIVSFDWLDCKEDRVGTSGRSLAPDGDPDEHYRLVLDLPPACTIEEIAITGGGDLRWTTRPSTRFGPVAVFADQQSRNRGQTLRLGTFSGRWTFELYVESDASIRPGHVFGAEVVLFIRGTRHHLTARCQRKS